MAPERVHDAPPDMLIRHLTHDAGHRRPAGVLERTHDTDHWGTVGALELIATDGQNRGQIGGMILQYSRPFCWPSRGFSGGLRPRASVAKSPSRHAPLFFPSVAGCRKGRFPSR